MKPLPLQRGQRFTAFGLVVPTLRRQGGIAPLPLALRAELVAGDGKVLLRSRVQLLQRQRQALHHVVRARLALAEAAGARAENGLEDVVQVRVAGIVGRVAGLLQAVGTELVVDLALVLVGENVVGLLHLLELRLTARNDSNHLDVASSVRVVLHGHLAEGLLDVVGRSVHLHFEQVVVRLVDGVSATAHIPGISSESIKEGSRKGAFRLPKENIRLRGAFPKARKGFRQAYFE